MGKIGIAFFALLALWLILKSVIVPLCSQRVKQKIAEFIGWMITSILLGTLVALLIAVLHILGSGFLELMQPFGEIFKR